MPGPLRIAMIGQKGVPARFGGVETHVEQIATRLAERGHHVTAFGRERFRSPDISQDSEGQPLDRGVHLAFRGSVNSKHLDAASHCFLCAAEAAFRVPFDVVHFHGIGPSAFAAVPKFAGRTVISTMHALDWRQEKWGRLASRLLRWGESMGVRHSHGVIAVSKLLVDHLSRKFGIQARYIPNGAIVADPVEPIALEQQGIEPGNYVLTVGRIISDRCLDVLIKAFKALNGSTKLVIVGAEVPRTEYSERLKAEANENVIFMGEQYGEELAALYSNCLFYLSASRVEGLPISVCEAMGFGKATLLSDIPEHREVAEDAGLYFPVNDQQTLETQVRKLLADRDDLRRFGESGVRRVATHYNWDRSAEQVEEFYYEVLAARGRRQGASSTENSSGAQVRSRSR